MEKYFTTLCKNSIEIWGKTAIKSFTSSYLFFKSDFSISVLTAFASQYNQENLTKLKSKNLNGNSTENKDAPIIEEGTEKKTGIKYDDGISILEALSATGLRSIRYAKEIPGVKKIIANDISARAVSDIKHNVKCNGVEDLVLPSENDAV